MFEGKGLKEKEHSLANKSSYERLLVAASLAFLIGCFLYIVSWFAGADIYHSHFFNHGSVVFVYNLFRIVFGLFLIWIIYAPGYAVFSALVLPPIRQEFSLVERVIFGFGIGLGLWQILMLILGIANLYYPSVMIWLCLFVLCASAGHFKDMATEVARAFATAKNVHFHNSALPMFTRFSIGFCLVWLLLVRGLYPGGAGDYYTHYFHYYMEVIRNHGLAPNDVWYHYYYSQGAGLTYLAILLTDPEAPEIVTFCCVTIAALALFAISSRILKQSLWPIFGAVSFLLYYIVSLGAGGMGEFQKTHEENAALVMIAVWALCMNCLEPKRWRRPVFILLALVMIGLAILSQAAVIYFAVYFGVCAAIALKTRNMQEVWRNSLLAVIAGGAVLAVFILNYQVAGLATDQALDLTWRFANLERLNQWGVIPNLLMVAWIRDNYLLDEVPWGWETLKELGNFMRVDALTVPLLGAICILALYCLARKFKRSFSSVFHIASPPEETICQTKRMLKNLALILSTFAILSVIVGHSQPVSYLRFSSFFFPLITLFVVLCWAIFINEFQLSRFYTLIFRIVIPSILSIAMLLSWNNWFHLAWKATRPALKFMVGSYSLADAYSHQMVGLPFGGINPAVFEATHHVPPGARIWCTNVDCYCMVPDCRVESVISFKLSSHLNEILNQEPEVAMRILRKEGLNYFLFSKESRLIDLLPYSRLFAPANIGDYLAIKWSNGTTYLLTWQGPGTTPIGPKFLKDYEDRLNEPEMSWFRFKTALPYMNEAMTTLMKSKHPWKPFRYPWRKNG